jgi:RHS repeat-associated protein
MGNRVYKKVEDISDPQNPTIVSEQKFLVDISSQLPVILCEIKPSDGSLKKSYIYADAQVLCQRYHDPVDPNFYDASYYVHDRLGSVRLVVVPEYDQQQQTWAVRAANSYTYTPFGSFYDGQCIENIANPFKFTGQWHDVEIDQYHLRARQYDPAMMRFTSRDPAAGRFNEPATLHRYLYCWNNPVNLVDSDGRFAVAIAARLVVGGLIGGLTSGASTNWDAKAMAIGTVTGMLSAAIPGPLLGATIGSVLGGGSAMYNSYTKGNDWSRIGLDGIIGVAAGGMSGIIGNFAGASGGDIWGLISFTAANVWGSSWGLFAGLTSDGGHHFTEKHIDSWHLDDPFEPH